jgi:hypothetical protein
MQPANEDGLITCFGLVRVGIDADSLAHVSLYQLHLKTMGSFLSKNQFPVAGRVRDVIVIQYDSANNP